MSLDPTLVAANGQPIQYTAGLVAPVTAQPVTATVQATAPTARQAAAAVQDVAGGIVQDLNKDAATSFAPYRKFLLTGLTVAGAYLLLLFGALIGLWVLTGNTRASSMLLGANTYAAPLIVGVVLYVAGWLTPTPRIK